jgi:hypothetical protein
MIEDLVFQFGPFPFVCEEIPCDCHLFAYRFIRFLFALCLCLMPQYATLEFLLQRFDSLSCL